MIQRWPIILGTTGPQSRAELSQKPERWAAAERRASSPHGANGASSVTEWVLQHEAEKWRVTPEVSEIKAGNLRASVFQQQCRRRLGSGYKKAMLDEGIIVCVGQILFPHQHVVMERWGSFNARVCSQCWISYWTWDNVNIMLDDITCHAIISFSSGTFYRRVHKLHFLFTINLSSLEW